jgi:hypothetical protein
MLAGSNVLAMVLFSLSFLAVFFRILWLGHVAFQEIFASSSSSSASSSPASTAQAVTRGVSISLDDLKQPKRFSQLGLSARSVQFVHSFQFLFCSVSTLFPRCFFTVSVLFVHSFPTLFSSFPAFFEVLFHLFTLHSFCSDFIGWRLGKCFITAMTVSFQ